MFCVVPMRPLKVDPAFAWADHHLADASPERGVCTRHVERLSHQCIAHCVETLHHVGAAVRSRFSVVLAACPTWHRGLSHAERVLYATRGFCCPELPPLPHYRLLPAGSRSDLQVQQSHDPSVQRSAHAVLPGGWPLRSLSARSQWSRGHTDVGASSLSAPAPCLRVLRPHVRLGAQYVHVLALRHSRHGPAAEGASGNSSDKRCDRPVGIHAPCRCGPHPRCNPLEHVPRHDCWEVVLYRCAFGLPLSSTCSLRDTVRRERPDHRVVQQKFMHVAAVPVSARVPPHGS